MSKRSARKKYISIRFYRMHDMDLLSLEERGIKLTKALYVALSAFARDECVRLVLPPRTNEIDFNRKSYHKVLILDKKEDAPLIDILDRFIKGGRTNFLKNLLRLYLFMPYDENYLKDSAAVEFMEKKLAIAISTKGMKKWTLKNDKKKKKIISGIVGKNNLPKSVHDVGNFVPSEEISLDVIKGHSTNEPVKPEETKDIQEEGAAPHGVPETNESHEIRTLEDSGDNMANTDEDLLAELGKIF